MKDKKYIKWIFELFYPYLKSILFIIILLVLSTFFSAIIPLLIQTIMDYGIIQKNFSLLIFLVVILIISNVIINLLGVIQEKQRIKIQTQVECCLREKSLLHIFKLKLRYIKKFNNLELVNSLETDITNIVSVLDENMMFVITKIFSMLGGLTGLIIINWKLSIVVFVCIPIKYFGMKVLSDKRERITESYISEMVGYNKWFGNLLSGVKEIKLFDIEKLKETESNEKIKDMLIRKKELNIVSQYNQSFDSLLFETIIALIYLIGGLLQSDFKITIGGIIAFVTYSTYVITPISSLLNIKYYLSGVMPSVKRYYKFMDLAEERQTGKNIAEQDTITINFQNVSFFYEENNPVLNNISFNAGLGDRLIILGRNGAGKTTFINLILLLYDEYSGDILINGINVKEINIQSYRELISVVSQDIYLFNDTIEFNILLGRKVSDEQLNQVIVDSGLEEFVKEHSLKYVVGENGSLVSGGEKQKIALARALIRNTPIIIFDEATSNLDQKSEKNINRLIEMEFKDKLIIMVTHKSDSIKSTDRVIDLSNKGKEETQRREVTIC